MALPKKISPDYIKEAVVEVRYLSSVSPEVLIGIFYEAFDETWFYTNKPKQAPVLPPKTAGIVQDITLKVGVESFLFNDKINIRLLPNSLVFTCLNSYIGWEEYKQEIERALTIFNSTKKITSWFRVGVRYISEYPNKNLKDCIKFTFSFGLPQVESVTTAFRSEFNYEGSKVILNLNNKVPVVSFDPVSKQNTIVLTSITDIDVFNDGLRIDNLPDLLKMIEDCHFKEKELYFEMLEKEFLHSLNPQY